VRKFFPKTYFCVENVKLHSASGCPDLSVFLVGLLKQSSKVKFGRITN